MKYKSFHRKVVTNGFKDHKSFDDFIQHSLDKFKFVTPSKTFYTNTGEYSKYIISNKSAIPDLIIYNKTFNKNDCFLDYTGKSFNKFPRVRYILKAKPRKNFANKNQESQKEEIVDVVKDNDDNIKEIKEYEVLQKEEDKNELNIVNKDKDDGNGGELNEKESSLNLTEEKVLTNPTMFFNQIKENDKKFNEYNGNIISLDNKESDIIKTNDDGGNNKENNNNINISNIKEEENITNAKIQSIPQRNKNSNQIIQTYSETVSFIPRENKKEGAKNDKGEEEEKEAHNKEQNKIKDKDEDEDAIHFEQLPKKELDPSKHIDNPINLQEPKLSPFISQMPPFLYLPPPIGPNPNQMNFPFNFPLLNSMNFFNFPLDETIEQENDPIYNNFNDDYSRYNPSIFLEKPVLIVKKNLIDRNWFIMKNNKIYGNFNSEELLYFLGEQIRKGNKFENMSVNDYQTDVFFKPSNLFDILRYNVPILKRKLFQHKMMGMVMNKQIINQNMMKNNHNIDK